MVALLFSLSCADAFQAAAPLPGLRRQAVRITDYPSQRALLLE
jgi:hypothetical protein